MKRSIWIVWGLLALATTMAGAAQSPPADPLARAPGTDFRVVVWNVFGLPGARSDRQPSFRRVLQALDADMLMLEEVSGFADGEFSGSAAEVASWLPVPASGAKPWQVQKRGGELVVAVRSPRELTRVFRRPRMAPATGFYDTLDELLNGPGSVAAVGILVTDGPRRLLAVPLHYPGGEADRLRAAPPLRDAVNQALTETRADAAIVAGDFNLYFERGANLVGRRDSLEILQRGITVNGSPLAVLEPSHLDGRSQATWRGGASSPPPGRLDWLLYSDATLTPLRSFVFEAADLSAEWLRIHGLDAHDSDAARTSDHLPIVADFRWGR